MTTLEIIIAELARQNEADGPRAPFIYRDDDPPEFGIDGCVDLVALAEAIDSARRKEEGSGRADSRAGSALDPEE